MSAGVIPAGSLGTFAPVDTPAVMLLRADVSSLPETVATESDLYPYEISTGGGYTAGATGLPMAALATQVDVATGTVEVTYPASAWPSSPATSLSLTFRWAVLIRPAIGVVQAWDAGSAQTLTAQPLVLDLAEASTLFPGSYVVVRGVA